ncbi:MAG TPA: N-acetylmuramoyl-L-alanine amidase family protein [Candidatus Blautia faecigallinarum]|uniref:N-acetylmuramoyl-L-alanine amidase family protein n=1 Tax=Candidatus Blautia faecigallinarum TaxID=2838488 RepID=A0A9D2ITM6_9FIRM|nr:N-acetylmuramoyl-L-alanine amidase family protein [Candidatus Blautia faecigallinarum]
MGNICKRFRIWGLFLLLAVFAAGLTSFVTAIRAQAAVKKGFQTINGKTYYIDADGSKHKGWLNLNGTRYYFDSKTGVQQKGWMKDSKGNRRYFTSSAGAMVTGWIENSKGQNRYFDPKTGIMKTKWLTLNGKKYYLYNPSGVAAEGVFLTDGKGDTRYFYNKTLYMAIGWLTNSKGEKRYFDKDGVMARGFAEIGDATYYFYSGSGKMATGWLKNSEGQRRYFDPKTGRMYTGTHTINGEKCTFNNNGVLQPNYDYAGGIAVPTGTKTIKNYLAGALQPIGKVLYVWGGGRDKATIKGVSSVWKDWYASQDSSYNYREHSNIAKGLDCSGYVGWAAYQVMHQKAGVGSGYMVTSGEIGSAYTSLGWGNIITLQKLVGSNYKLMPGDVGYNPGHTFIVLGQCPDKSAVILHCTPNAGCQIAGTTTPSGSSSSQAVALAQKYMSRYPGFSKYDYRTCCGDYLRQGNFLRWNSSTLSDPDGYRDMTAEEILADLFKS